MPGFNHLQRKRHFRRNISNQNDRAPFANHFNGSGERLIPANRFNDKVNSLTILELPRLLGELRFGG